MMQAVRRRGTGIELAVRKIVRSLGLRYRVNPRGLPGTPDLSNQRGCWAIFVHGCFWHGHPNCIKTRSGPHGKIPVSNSDFWTKKIEGNRRRDSVKANALRQKGFRVLTVWECEIRQEQALRQRLAKFLRCDCDAPESSRMGERV